jgi:hypothetical protein
VEQADGLLRLVASRNVCRGDDGVGRILLVQFLQQLRPSSHDAHSVAILRIALEKGFSNAGGGPDDQYIHIDG